MIIRAAKFTDAEGIARVHDESMETTYSGILNKWLDNLSHEQHVMMWKNVLSAETNEFYENFIMHVAENEPGGIIGFVFGGKKRQHDNIYTGELFGIYLLREYQRQGIGHKMISAFAQSLLNIDVESMMVWDLAENEAIRFYEKLGGRKICENRLANGDKEYTLLNYGWKDIRLILNDNASLMAERNEIYDQAAKI
jgi:ribosomal protein S18 acetylase RimI-like enzyme